MLSNLRLPVLLAALAAAAHADVFPPFNAGVGTQTFAPTYGFTTNSRLVESAGAIHDLGSDVIKFNMDRNTATAYGLPPFVGMSNLTMLARDEPSFRHVLDMPFRYFMIWTYPFTVPPSHYWRNGVSGPNAALEYSEVYDFARYLLHTYNGSGKSFLLGHWEGDWSILNGFDKNSDPSSTNISGMVDWYRVRQLAVDDARLDEPHTNVFIYHYAEVNLVKKAMTGGVTVVNNVLAYCTNDLVSYSSYDTQLGPESDFTNALAYIETHSHTKGDFPKNVFVGEYGFPVRYVSGGAAYTAQQQSDLSKSVITWSAGWGCPFTLYWEMYNNEIATNGAQMGFWLINNLNQTQPSYDLHRSFLGRAHGIKNLYRFWLQRNPDAGAFAYFGSMFDFYRTSVIQDQFLASGEYATLVPDSNYVTFLLHSLLHSDTTADPDYTNFVNQLAAGTSRVAVLNAVLDGARFSNACPNNLFAEMLLGGTLQQADIGPASTNVLALAARLGAGALRSVVWREYLDRDDFYSAELPLRLIDEVGARVVFTKYWFDFDRDADGMDDAWEHGIINASPGDAIATIEDVQAMQDYDGDRVDNHDEFIAGTDPLDAASYFKADSLSILDSLAPVLFWSSQTGLLYDVMQSATLVSWTSVYTAAGTGSPLGYTNSAPSDGPIYFHVRVTR